MVSWVDLARRLSVEELASIIDHTLLNPSATMRDLENAIDSYRKYRFACLALSPYHALLALRNYGDVRICAVVGFPMGFDSPRTKISLARELLEAGASEIDMVMNIQAFKSRDLKVVEEEIRDVVEVAKDFGAVVKVIIETGLLSDEEKVLATELVARCGAHYVKTCTGFLGGKATVHDVTLLKRVSRGRVKVKASGGIRHVEDALTFVAVGADRIGTSSGVRIVDEFIELKKSL